MEVCKISIHTTTQVVTIFHDGERLTFVISIHTTTQVVTNLYAKMTQQHSISIHTTTQVVTEQFIDAILAVYDFNPHHHAGGDPMPGLPSHKTLSISIHTTTQVVTINNTNKAINKIISIHTTTQVVTEKVTSTRSSFEFQSTPPRRW